jgi:CheY-like chemotaxis protein
MPKKILLIDGDPLARSLAAALAPAGFSVDVATAGQEGIDAAHAARPDAIVLAVELPGTSGYVVCNRVKKDEALREIPLLLTSSAATAETFEQHKKLRTRADDYLLKPFAPEVLAERLRALVGAPPVAEAVHAAGTGEDIDAVDSTLAALDAAASAPAGEDDGELRAFDEAFDAMARVVDEPLPAPSPPPADDGERRAVEGRLARAEGDLEQARRRIAELEAEVAQHEQRVARAYRQLKGDEQARAKARKALAIALQLLEGAPAAVPDVDAPA